MYQKTALIIDDSPTSQAVLKRLLKDIDLQVDTRKSGAEALLFLQSHTPDVIFLDHIMPGLDGFQILRQIKANPATRDIPVVMYTSQNALKYTSEARALGAIGVLPKQISHHDLAFIMQRVEQSAANQSQNDSSDIVIDIDVATKDKLQTSEIPEQAWQITETPEEAEQIPEILEEAEQLTEILEEAEQLTEIELLTQALRNELELQRKEFLARQRSFNAELEHRLALQAGQLADWQMRHQWRNVAAGILIVIPILVAIYFASEASGQKSEIARLQTALQQQNEHMRSDTGIARAGNDRADRDRADRAEWEDMKFMLETLIATVETQARAGKPIHAREVMRQAEASTELSMAHSADNNPNENPNEASSQSDVDEPESRP